jgi:fructose-1,6-bisphosphatase-3
VIDTETGRQLKEQISDLEKLLHAYRTGQILEKE